MLSALLVSILATLTLSADPPKATPKKAAPKKAAKREKAPRAQQAPPSSTKPDPKRPPLAWRFDRSDPQAIDGRFGKWRTLNDLYHPWSPPEDLGDWQRRSKELRTQLLVATGLWPKPARPPLKPVIHGKIDKGDYTVEKVYFASLPGHYVSGNLYRPKGVAGPRPGILLPHGHWQNGRLHDAGEVAARKQLAEGAEQFFLSARFPLQPAGATLARAGCVAFIFDMVGVADSKPIEHGKGFADVQAILWGQSAMGLQTWNALRSLDFLCSLPDVDARRIGVTGASGGGTQTFVLGAIDDRPAVTFPAVMVSTAMQGGCVCENCPLLRVGTTNVEIAALFAPRPLGMTAAKDWTENIETRGLPELKRLYASYRVPEHVMARTFLQFGHNYNQVSREVMYAWMNRHLAIAAEPFKERPIDAIAATDLSVFDETHPRPADALSADQLRAVMTKSSREEFDRMKPREPGDLGKFLNILRPALEAMIVDRGARPGDVEARPVRSTRTSFGGIDRFYLHRRQPATLFPKESIPAVLLQPTKANGRVIVWIAPGGIADVFEKDSDHPIPAARAALKQGVAILAIDPLLVGHCVGANGKESLSPPDPRYPGYTFCYNRTLLAQRVHDVLTAIGAARDIVHAEEVDLLGLGEAGPWALLAKGIAGSNVRRAAVDFAGFSFADVKDATDPGVLPCALKYGDLVGLAMACAPDPLRVRGIERYPFGKVKDLANAYLSGGAPRALEIADEKDPSATSAVEWLLK